MSLADIEELKRKAALLDEAVEWMIGRLDSAALLAVHGILTRNGN